MQSYSSRFENLSPLDYNMKHQLRATIVAALVSLMTVSACSFPTAIQPSSIPAAEVAPNRRINTSAYYVISDDILTWQKNVRPMGLSGSAHTWQVDLGTPTAETLRRTLDAAFTTAAPGIAPPSMQNALNFRFDLEDADARIMFVSGFFSAVSRADVQIVIRVRVMDASGTEITRSIVQGTGGSGVDGQMDAMGGSIAAAAERAIRNMATDFVYKVINTGALAQAAVPMPAPTRR